ncbi:MAG TPA: DCC1-like thiol-disulfide oxidoreductase family protein [Acidimicrobiales bacterium]|nr:DCC1-like thiol-disulfide oxidoreductase family protein [Acidimicrobiales bacterium]
MATDVPTSRPPTDQPVPTGATAPSTGHPGPVFLYDGDCAFCTTCARFIERRIPTTAEVLPWQHADLAALGVDQADAEEAVVWLEPGGTRATGPEAIAELLVDAGSAWRPLGRLLRLRGVSRLAWPVYRWVARNRHRMPGGTAACSLPQAERDRGAG